MLALALSLFLTTATIPNHPQGDPAIRIKLSEDVLMPGDRAKVRIKTTTDGYLLVLRIDGEGRVRVLYPLDPEDSSTVRGGKEFEIKGRGDREGLTVDERQGRGTVFAAISTTPFQFDDYTRGGHWDYRALSADSTAGDPESRLLDIVDRMTDGHYDYDVVTYQVWSDNGNRPRAYSGWYGPRYYDPFYSPFYPFYGPRFGFGFGVRFGRPFRYRRWF
jgi:hypothetical protein